MPDPLWTLDNIHLCGGSRPRLAGISLSVHLGSTAILGLSGAGKTSLLNLLVGFEPPDRGQLTCHPSASTRLPVYWAPADGGLWPHLTVRQHLNVVCANADEWILKFDLSHVATACPASLSLGERSRLAIARGLAADAEILVCDEPLAHVDSARLRGYWDIIQQTCTERATSLVFAHHDPEIVLRHAQQVICLEDGQLAWQGATTDLYRFPPNERLGWLLGPLNWFHPADSRTWLGVESSEPVALRPEQVDIVPTDVGRLQVSAARSCGRLGELDITIEGDAHLEPRRIYHRPSRTSLTPGARVLLRICSWLLLISGLASLHGCTDSRAAPPLPVAEFVPRALPAEGAKLPAPRGLTFSPNGELFVLDDVGRVLVFGADGKLDRQWWMPEYSVGRPEGVCIMHDGRIVVADTHYNRCVFFDLAGNFLSTFGSFGEAEGEFIYPIAVTQDADGFLYVAENGGNDRVQKFTAEGEFVLAIGTCGVGPGEFQRPSGLAWHASKLYVADAFNSRVHRFADSGEFEAIIADAESTGLHYPYDMAQGPDHTLYLIEYGSGRLTHLDLEGRLLGQYGSVGRGHGEFWTPWGLTVKNDGTVYVADTGNRRLVELKP